MRYSHDLPTLCFLAANEVVHAREGPLLGIANCCSHLYSSPYLLLGSHFWLWHIRYHSLTLLLFLAYQVPFMHPNGHCHCPCHVSLWSGVTPRCHPSSCLCTGQYACSSAGVTWRSPDCDVHACRTVSRWLSQTCNECAHHASGCLVFKSSIHLISFTGHLLNLWCITLMWQTHSIIHLVLPALHCLWKHGCAHTL